MDPFVAVMIVGLLLGVFLAMASLGDLPGQSGPPSRRSRRRYHDEDDY